VGNVIYCFVANLADFLTVKEFENSSRFDEIIVTLGWHIFLRQCSYAGTVKLFSQISGYLTI